MIRSARATGAAALLALVAVPVTPAGPASAVSGRCQSGEGVTVVVDYGPLGGGVVIACDPDGGGKPAAEVVKDAGFTLEYVSSQPGFVCRLNGRPSADEGEDCADTPPADAYWGLFWSDGEPATWVYSSEGAGSLDVPDGGSIGWRFQDGGDRENPSAPPTAAAAQEAPSPQPTRTPSQQPSKPPSKGPAAPSPTPSTTAPSTPSTSAPPKEQPSTSSGTAPEDAGSKSRGGPGVRPRDDKGSAQKEKRDREDQKKGGPGKMTSPSASPSTAALSPASDEPLSDVGSSTVLTVVAGGAVLLLAGAAGVIAWRRRA